MVQKYISIQFRRKIYLFLSNVSLILLFYGIWEIKPVIVEVNDFLGLTSHLGIIYWLGLFLITLCSIFIYLDYELKNDMIFIYILIIVGLFLFGLGVFVEENARAWSSYYPPAEVKNILEYGYINITSDYPLISYRCWPALHLISSFIISMGKIELIGLIKYMPLFFILIFILITFTIGKLLTGSSNQAFLISLLSISSFWHIYYYYSPQSYGYLSFLFLFVIMVIYDKSPKTNLMMILFFILSTICHLFYGFVSLLTLLAHSLSNKQYKITIFIIVIFFAWYVFLADLAFTTGVIRFIDTVGDYESIILLQLDKFTPVTQIKAQVDTFRFIYLFTHIILFLTSLIIYKFGKIESERKDYIKTCIYWLIIISSFGMIKYGDESLERMYIFSIVLVISVIVISFSNLDRRILVGIIILFIGIHIPAHYGSDSFLAAHTSELKGSEFLALKVNLSSLNTPPLGLNTGYYIYPHGGDRYVLYNDPSLVVIKHSSMKLLELPNAINRVRYIIWGIHSSNVDWYYYGEDSVKQWIISNNDNKDVMKIYSNGGFDLYEHRLHQPSWGRRYN